MRQLTYALACCMVALCALCTSLAAAHGTPPRALAPLRSDAGGLLQVRLSAGCAQRSGAKFRYLCPAAWGGDESSLAAGASSELVIVGASSGLSLLEPTGVTRPLPGTPAEPLLASASSALGLFTLHAGSSGSALYRVTADGARRVWHDAGLWLSIAAGGHTLQLLALTDGTLTQLLLSPDGRELARSTASVPADVSSVHAHMVHDAAYAVLRDSSGASTLGHIEQGFQVDASAQGSLSGPIPASAGGLLVGLDGQLTIMMGSRSHAVVTDEPVSCLSVVQGQGFACTRTGLRLVQDDRLGARMFDFASLLEPDLQQVSESRRDACSTQWLHFRFELIAAGLLPVDVTTPDLPHASTDAGPDAAAGAEVPDGGAGAKRESSGCSSASQQTNRRHSLMLVLLMCAAVAVLRRSRRRRDLDRTLARRGVCPCGHGQGAK
jgi:hypothetical protein